MSFTPHMASLLIKKEYKSIDIYERNYCFEILCTSPIDAYHSLDSKTSCIIPRDIISKLMLTIKSDPMIWQMFLVNVNMQRRMYGNICPAINLMNKTELVDWVNSKMTTEFIKNVESYRYDIDKDKFDIIQSYLVMKKIDG